MPIALIGKGAVGVAVAKYDLSRCQSWTDDLINNLGAGGVKEQRLGAWTHLGARGVEQHSADGVADGRAAGFARDQNGQILGLKRGGKSTDLRRLAATFRPLKGDEEGHDSSTLSSFGHPQESPDSLY